MKKKRIRITAVAGLCSASYSDDYFSCALLYRERKSVCRNRCFTAGYWCTALDVNPYSGHWIESRVKGVVIHYTANPEVRLRITEIILMAFNIPGRRSKQALIVGLDGEIATMCTDMGDRLCIEWAKCRYSIDWSVTLTKQESLLMRHTVLLYSTAWLCVKFDWKKIRLFAITIFTGKIVLKYFVENEDAWEMFKR